MTYKNFADQIAKTGFVLENRIAQALKAAKWTVISNRYYVDDTEESVREIDLIAYQVNRVQHLDVYTTLIISCKKSQECVWALLARDIDLKDPNTDWHPLHAWSNDKVLAFQLGRTGCGKRYHTGIANLGAASVLQTPAVDVFAFQEMNKKSGACQNDKNIFTAVTTLMKAQAYELGSLPQRKKSPCVYQFNLLSVVDADLVRLMFSEQNVEATRIESEHYVARYIIKKREIFSRIRFINADSFANAIADYGALHLANCNWFGLEYEAFFQDVVKNDDRLIVLAEDFRKAIAWHIRYTLIQNSLVAPKFSEINLSWNQSKGVLQICAPVGTKGASVLNADTGVAETVVKALQSIYHYVGEFEFDDDSIPL
jgi:hypothetical protein